MHSAFLGIDCGTQSTKALLLDADTGEELASAGPTTSSSPRPMARASRTRPGGWTRCRRRSGRRSRPRPGREVAGIGVSGQQHGLVALDARDRPVRPAKLWNDTTTAADCVTLTERMGGEAAVHAATGNVFLPGYTAPKVEWLRRVEPERYAEARRFGLPHDYLNLWLTGTFATEAGDASGTAYLDVRTRAYAPAALARHRRRPRLGCGAAAGARGAARCWARCARRPPRRSGCPPGSPSRWAAATTCAPRSASARSCPGVAVMSLGTSGTVFGHATAPAIDPLREVSAFCDSTGGWLPLACVLNCTLPLEWARDLFGLDHAGFDALVSGVSRPARAA